MIHASPLPGHFLAPNSSLLYSKQPPLHPRCPLGRLRSTEVGFCFFWISAISAHSHPTPDHPVHFTYTRPPTRLRKPASAAFFPFSEANSSVLVHFKIRPRGGEGLGGRTCRPRYWPVTRLGKKGVLKGTCSCCSFTGSLYSGKAGALCQWSQYRW